MCWCQLHLHVQKALRLQVTWWMITFAFQMRERRLPIFARRPVSAQMAAVVRTEDACVSHDRLLTTSGYRGASTAVSNGARVEHLSLRFADAVEVADALGLADIAGITVCPEANQPAATCAFPPQPESARRAREFTRITLQDWGMGGQVDLAELVVSELITNSLRHGLLSAQWMPGEHPIGLTIVRLDPYLMCLVTDPGLTCPVRIDSCASAEGGRGLQVVEACSVRWGWEPVAGEGKVVWALLR
jgi:anti-sigma regulatory factor (Ser/Thr protein kinase)